MRQFGPVTLAIASRGNLSEDEAPSLTPTVESIEDEAAWDAAGLQLASDLRALMDEAAEASADEGAR